MKRVSILLLLTLLFSSCTQGEAIEKDTITIEKTNTDYVVGSKENNYLNIYGNILNNNIKSLNSHISGTIQMLDCEVGNKVDYNTIIAKIEPDTASVTYKNNFIQINSLNEQYSNLQSIRNSTLLNFESQIKQLELSKSNIVSQLSNLNSNLEILKNQKDLSGNDLSLQLDSVKKQIVTLEESKTILEKNKSESLSTINVTLDNLRGQIINSSTKSLERLDKTFGLSTDNKNENDDFEDFLGAKDANLKNDTENEIRALLITSGTNGENLDGLTNTELSTFIDGLSETLKNAADVMNESIASSSSLTETTIAGLNAEFLGYSDALLTYKTSFDGYINSISTTSLTFDVEIKAIESSLTSLYTSETNIENNGTQSNILAFDTNINNSQNQIDTLEISLTNIEEQLSSIEDSKNSSIKQIDNQASQLQDSIGKTTILLSGEELYAGINGIVKQSSVKEGNSIVVGTPVCTIVPVDDSLKLELYSPNILEIGTEFEYSKDGEYVGTGTITSESPVRNSMTQNYVYEGSIKFDNIKEGDYIDIKVLTESNSSELWVPLTYVFPKLDGYYVQLGNFDQIQEKKVEVGKMNNGEIQIISGLNDGDILKQ